MPATSHGSAKLEKQGNKALWKSLDIFPKQGGGGFDLGTNISCEETPPALVPLPEWEELPSYEVGTTPPPIVEKILGYVPQPPPVQHVPDYTPRPIGPPPPAVKEPPPQISAARRTVATLLGMGAALFFVYYLLNTRVGNRFFAALILAVAALWVRFSKSKTPVAIQTPAPAAARPSAAAQEPTAKRMFNPNTTERAREIMTARGAAISTNLENQLKTPDWGVSWDPTIRKGMGITFGSAQTGKGVSTIIPALLTYGGAMFTLDVKAELAAITADRRRQMGCKVDIIDPFGEVNRVYGERGGWTEKITKYNPLAALDPKAMTFADDVAAMGEAIFVDQAGGENASFFNGSARELGIGIIAGVVLQRDDERLPPEKRGPGTFREVRRILALDADKFTATCAAICKLFPGSIAALKLERFAVATKTTDAVLFTAWEQTKFLDSEQLLRSMEPEPGEPVFTLESLSTPGSNQTVYTVIPATELVTHSRYLRLVVMQTMRSVLRARSNRQFPLVMLLDEAGTAIGHLSVIEQAYGLTAGLGVTVWTFYQNIGQLKRDYPKDYETFIGNSSMVQLIAARDQETCEYFSKYLGNSTEPAEAETESRSSSSTSGYSKGSNMGNSTGGQYGSSSFGITDGQSTGSSEGSSTTKSRTPMSRPLKYPDEIRNMDPRNLLVCFPGDKQYEVRKIIYYKDPRYAGLFRPDPTKPGFVKPASAPAPTPVAANDNGEIILSTAEENKADFDNYWGIGDKFMAADDQFWNDVIAHLRALPDDEAREMMLDRYNERTRESLRALLEQQPAGA